MTWVAPNKKIVYLTENNNFFTVKFRRNRMDESCFSSQGSQDFMQLTQENIEVIQNNLCQVEYLTKEPERLRKAIAEERKKHSLLATSKKDVSAFIEYVESCQDTLEANITLQTWEDFDPSQWNLLAIFKAGNENTSKTANVEKVCCIAFPQDYIYKGLTVSLELIAKIDVGDESICIQVPVKKVEISYLKLFSKNRIGKNNKAVMTVNLPTPKTNAFKPIDVDVLEKSTDRTSFLGSEVGFAREGDLLAVRSSDPIALYVVKSLLIKSEGSSIPLGLFINQEMKSDLDIAWNSDSVEGLYKELRGLKT